MKEYPKTYENFFYREGRADKCRPGLVGVSGDESIEEYQNLLKKTLRETQIADWEKYLKLNWLFRKFSYAGRRRFKNNGNGVYVDSAFAIFLQNYLGYSNRIFSVNRVMPALSTYFDELYPDYELLGPFKATYTYPYFYMNFECLLFVYRMPERIELLEIGEQRAMNYGQFGDYVINYIMCYNEEYGDKYVLSGNNTRSPAFPHIRLYETSETTGSLQEQNRTIPA